MVYGRAFGALSLALIVTMHPLTARASASSSSSSSSGSGGAATPGSVVVNGGGGQLEGEILAAEAMDSVAAKICARVTAVAPTKPVLIGVGTDRPDGSDWNLFVKRVEVIKAEYIDAENDFLVRDGQVKLISVRRAPAKSHRGNDANESVERKLGHILVGLAPTGTVMEAFQGLQAISAGTSSNTQYGGASISFSDYSLAVGVGTCLQTPTRNVALASQLDTSGAAIEIDQKLHEIEVIQQLVRQKQDLSKATADVKLLAGYSKTATLAETPLLGQLTAAINIDIANFTQADSDFRSLKSSLTQSVSTAASGTGGTGAASSAQSDAPKTPASTAPTNSTTLLATLMRERTVDSALDSRGILLVKIEFAGGSYVTRENLLSLFGKDYMRVSGGVKVDFTYSDKDGKSDLGTLQVLKGNKLLKEVS